VSPASTGNDTRYNMSGSFCASLLLAMALLFPTSQTASAVEKKYWELSPYTVRIELAVDDAALNQASLDARLATYLRERILSTLHPLWSIELEVVEGQQRHLLLDSLSTLEQLPAPESNRFDKRMFLTVAGGIDGYTIACREWDKHTRLWGPVLRRSVRQELMLSEQCFDLLRATFAPLATVRVDPDDETRATLVFKGSELPRRTEDAAFGRVGEVYQPLLIRFDHTGEVLPDGISVVPWTYLTLEREDHGKWQCAVHTGIRLPFGIRRRGRSEHLAIAVRNPPGPTRVRFYVRHDPSQGLSGYEVFRRLPYSNESEPLGLTDATGSVTVEPTGANIVMLFLRSDGQLLAKIPVAPGAKPLLEVPIADDTARLRAQSELTALREQLIDVVARRSILMARVRARMEEGKIDEARELLAELDDLPGRAQFDQMITAAERSPQNASKDPRIEQRIDKLFADTRVLLGRFLDVRQISELRSEVNAAARGPEN
jgi:hypothetical protein